MKYCHLNHSVPSNRIVSWHGFVIKFCIRMWPIVFWMNGSAIFPSNSWPGSLVPELRGAGMNSRELLRTRLFCSIIFFLDYRGKFEYFLNFFHHKNPLKLTDLPWESHGIKATLTSFPGFPSLVAPRNRSREERDWERGHKRLRTVYIGDDHVHKLNYRK